MLLAVTPRPLYYITAAPRSYESENEEQQHVGVPERRLAGERPPGVHQVSGQRRPGRGLLRAGL